MINAPYENEFVFHDGKRAKNILELSEIVERLSVEEFSSFVNMYKNDFANWTEFVLMDKRLSDKLRQTVSLEQVKSVLKARLSEIIAEEIDVSEPIKPFYKGSPIPEQSIKAAHSHELKNILSSERITANKASSSDYVSDVGVPHRDNLFERISGQHLHHKSDKTEGFERASGQKDMERKKESKKWYEFFKRDISRKSIDKSARAMDDKFRPEKELKQEEKETYSENMLWIVLYGLLVGLIIILLVYKFVFNH